MSSMDPGIIVSLPAHTHTHTASFTRLHARWENGDACFCARHAASQLGQTNATVCVCVCLFDRFFTMDARVASWPFAIFFTTRTKFLAFLGWPRRDDGRDPGATRCLPSALDGCHCRAIHPLGRSIGRHEAFGDRPWDIDVS